MRLRANQRGLKLLPTDTEVCRYPTIDKPKPYSSCMARADKEAARGSGPGWPEQCQGCSHRQGTRRSF